MQIKRFTAAKMNQALKQVRRELGNEAVIISTARLPQGGVEVCAAVDPSPVSPPSPAQGTSPAPEAPPAPRTMGSLARSMDGLSGVVSRYLMCSEAAAGFTARPELAPLHHHLSKQEVDPEVMVQLLDNFSAPGGRGLMPRLSIRLKKLFQVGQCLQFHRGKPLIWALVGPTGVGKTTTLAKLAASFTLSHNLKVGMISVDAFRMAAGEQLRFYGSIMEIPTLDAGRPVELKEAVDELACCHLILVDTVGRSPADQEGLKELRTLLAAVPEIKTHLVMALTTRDSDLVEVRENFAAFNPQTLIFTKLDETRTFGPILNQCVKSGLPVSYLADGQKVPDDLTPATREGLARLLMPQRKQLEKTRPSRSAGPPGGV